MNKRDKKIAEQAGWPESLVSPVIMVKLKEFADLIRADEREACALICDEHADDPVYCGAAIRARGNT